MGLYLAVFDQVENELGGVEVGSYDDFYQFRDAVTRFLERGNAGSRFPVLIQHSDCDGEWSVEECHALEAELNEIAEAFKKMSAICQQRAEDESTQHLHSIQPSNLYDYFVDIDGEPLIGRLHYLCRLTQEHGRPIVFQ